MTDNHDLTAASFHSRQGESEMQAANRRSDSTTQRAFASPTAFATTSTGRIDSHDRPCSASVAGERSPSGRPIEIPEFEGASTVDREQLQALLAGQVPLRLVMVQPDRFRAAHIPGSETFQSFDAALDELDTDERIVVYCAGGHASSQAQRWLQGQGYRRVARYPGGLADWHSAGLPLAGDNRLEACR